jgi:peptidoglycan/xylan/chitin deacetylase (PgdA/CDA1 family)
MSVAPGDLAEQLVWLRRRRRVVPLSDGLARLDKRGRLPRGTAVLTFDDGFSSLYDHLLPLVRMHRMPVTVFLVANTLSTEGQHVDWVRRPPGWDLTTLTRDQVLEMQDAGVDFQSHSWAHLDLPSLGYEACRLDLQRSRELLEELLGRRVPFLAYPRGRHDEQVRRAAEAAGYTHAVALPEGSETPGPYAVPRVGIHGSNSLMTVKVKANRAYLPLKTSRIYRAVRQKIGR